MIDGGDPRDVTGAIAAYWDRRAPAFDGVASHVRDADSWRIALAAAFGPSPARDVIDLGCGTGACAMIAASLGHRVLAVDAAPGMVAVARAAAHARGLAIDFTVAAIDAPSLPAASADIVTLRNVLWTQPQPEGTLRAAKRLLRPGGRIVVSDAHWDAAPAGRSTYPVELVAALPFHRGLLEHEARAMLAAAGFTAIEAWQHLVRIGGVGGHAIAVRDVGRNGLGCRAEAHRGCRKQREYRHVLHLGPPMCDQVRDAGTCCSSSCANAAVSVRRKSSSKSGRSA
jgi:ubiquinone/menaquinone biosynthesis C-methylase UbiE